MWVVEAVVVSIVLSVIAASELDFPPGFKFGVASAAYQIEGAWNVSDKSESIWDYFTHTQPTKVKGHSNGDVTADSYHLWRRDIEMLEELGVNFYRFSISWTRLLPNGFPTKISEDGRKYYSDLIDAILEKGIEPMVTLYHWDIPLRLHRLGGWMNPLVSDWFADYARVVFTLFADRVKTFLTINESTIMCDMTYNTGAFAPWLLDTEVAPYLCTKHTLVAHAKAYRIYEKEFRDKYHGRVALTTETIWFDPYTKEDENLAELARLNVARSYHAVYSKEGGWPPEIEKILAENSKKKGYPRSNLPPFTKEEIDLVKGTFDFFAMNHYTSRLIRPARAGDKVDGWPVYGCEDLNGFFEYAPHWIQTSSDWFYANPPSIRQHLNWLRNRYGDMEYIITENGFPNLGGRNDQDRLQFIKENLQNILLSIKEDKVNVTGYTAWTLMDNFEWADGYKSKFGIYEVDFTSPNKTRTPRASALYYKSVIAAHSLDVPNVYVNDTSAIVTSPSNDVLFNEKLMVIGIVIIIAAAVVVIAVYAWRSRRRLTQATRAPLLELNTTNYIQVKTDDE